MAEPLLSPTFLFRFALPCRYKQPLWSPQQGAGLEPAYALRSLGELEGKTPFAELRIAWSETGEAFSLNVTGKTQPPWCRDTKIDDSDGLQLWIDTRNTQNIHRAGRFCHRFAFLPAGGGAKGELPLAALLAINRARESPREIERGALQVKSRVRADGYSLEGFIAAEALTGYGPADHPKLGFTYCVSDREKGLQTFSVGPEFPFDEDPSVWGTLELVK